MRLATSARCVDVLYDYLLFDYISMQRILHCILKKS